MRAGLLCVCVGACVLRVRVCWALNERTFLPFAPIKAAGGCVNKEREMGGAGTTLQTGSSVVARLCGVSGLGWASESKVERVQGAGKTSDA